MGMRAALVLAATGLTLFACGESAQFRPAKGVKDLPVEKTSYRVKELDPSWSCTSIGFVVEAPSIDEIAETTASNGGTHYRVLEDFGHATLETDFNGTRTSPIAGLTTTQGHATSRIEKHHKYVAEAYRCAKP
jgi:hypothetical protein